MKDKNWTDIVSKQGDLRHFASMAIRKSGKSEHTSAQEIDFLFRIALSEEPLTPRQITNAMGISKTIVSRLTDHLESKGFICKEASASDRRSYCIRITGAGKDEIDRMYYYYLDPLYTLQKNMKKEKFETLFQLIREANEILSSQKNKGDFIMTFYQELQLSSTGSKQLIKNTTDKKEKRRHILIYNFKVYLVMVFCVAVVSLYSKFIGNDNSVVGVTVLLAVLVLRQADYAYLPPTLFLLSQVSTQSLWQVPVLPTWYPRFLHSLSMWSVSCLLMILGCHNVIMYNHSTFVLGYLLLFGYDVSGHAYILRLEGLLVGMILCMIIFYKNQKNRPYRRKFSHLFQEFNIHSARSRWYIKLTFIVSSAMLIMSLLGLPRAMWAGIACMSVCLPFTNDCVARSGKRWMFNIVGGLLFVVLYTVLPESMYAYIGIIGGIGVGYSAGYSWQTVFNTFGALSIASGLFGMPYAVALRIGANLFGSVYTVLCNKLFDKAHAYFHSTDLKTTLS